MPNKRHKEETNIEKMKRIGLVPPRYIFSQYIFG